MLFNSIDFAVFLPIIFICYWLFFKNKTTYQNILLLVASYIFYGWWNWKFLFLISFSTIIDYSLGILINKEKKQVKRKVYLYISLGVNLGLLAFFKYSNFFLESFIEAFSFFGTQLQSRHLNIILPVGISFYTFQTLSYTIDVYRKKIQPDKNLIVFSTYVSFFPQLVAGPIEKAVNLLPQFYTKKVFSYSEAILGLRQIIWGLFKKIVIADTCAEFANLIFDNPSQYNGFALVLGTVFFAFQIYGDFSGYSDIAIGTARLFGIKLMKNFAFPYFSRDMAEFWRRWHISLNTWFKEYLYIPLGGSKGSKKKIIRNIFIIFLISGFWHGANWTFIAWGFINALYFIPLLLTNKNRDNMGNVAEKSIFVSLREIISISKTFALTCFGWIFFRSESIYASFFYIKRMLFDLFKIEGFYQSKLLLYKLGYLLILVFIGFIVVEWLGRKNEFAIEKLTKIKFLRWSFYSLLIFLIGMFVKTEEMQFIYFQF